MQKSRESKEQLCNLLFHVFEIMNIDESLTSVQELRLRRQDHPQ